MGLRDVIRTIREYPAVHAELEAARTKLRQAQQTLEQSKQECESLSLTLIEQQDYPRFYDKRMVTVRDSEGRSLSVMAYVMDERFREPILPTDSYYNGILEGYRQNDMPTDCLKRAWEHCAAEVHAMTEQVNSLFAQRPKPPKGRGSHER